MIDNSDALKSFEWSTSPAPRYKKKPIWIALISSVVTLCATLLLLNFATGEKRIERLLERRYEIDDPQLVRLMSSLLSPGRG